MGEEAGERAVEIAARAVDLGGDIGGHLVGDLELREAGSGRLDLVAEDRAAQVEVERFQLHRQPAGKARAHPLVEALQLVGGPVGGDDDLTAGVEQRVEHVAELGLHRADPAGIARRR